MRFFLLRLSGLLIALVALPANPLLALTAGEVIPAWSAGELDIHHINTTRGEAAFLILPDNTTILIDAGDIPAPQTSASGQTRSTGEFLAGYIRHMLSHNPNPVIDYALLTHFHSDHMGEPTGKSKKSAGGDYLLAGITEVGEYIKIRKVIDRAWPEYNYPLPLDNPMVNNYRKFLQWQINNNGLQVERFQAGRLDQIVLLREPQKYPEFAIQNIAVNGEIWTGTGTTVTRQIPPTNEIESKDWEDQPNENMFSTVLHLRYGKFDYYTGGDIPGYPWPGAPAWGDLETPVAGVVGPVDALKLNHHGFVDSANEIFLRTLQPRVIVIQVLGSGHLSAGTLRRLVSRKLYPGPRDICTTNFFEAMKAVLGAFAAENLTSRQGTCGYTN